MLAASTASKKGSSSDGGIMRLRKPVCRTAHKTSSRMAPWWQPYPDVPKEAMGSNSAAWASRRRPNALVIHLGSRLEAALYRAHGLPRIRTHLHESVGAGQAHQHGADAMRAYSQRLAGLRPLILACAGSSLWSAKTVPLAKIAAVRRSSGGEYSGSVGAGGRRMEGFHDYRRRSGVDTIPSIDNPSAAFAEAARALADRRSFRRRALRDVPAAGSSPASIL
eukprot:jgi/Tetstr1/435627/TSEL_024528.t1